MCGPEYLPRNKVLNFVSLTFREEHNLKAFEKYVRIEYLESQAMTWNVENTSHEECFSMYRSDNITGVIKSSAEVGRPVNQVGGKTAFNFEYMKIQKGRLLESCPLDGGIIPE